ncbi:MAG TPA: hypothetical protein VFA43_21285, partial [Gemmatimonadaceae bacterium]|nr:hypothetical protein [Gemmatimonadaceae bacterium]
AKDFKQLEVSATAANADSQLLALKQKMGLLGAGAAPDNRQLGAGGQAHEEIVHDAEVEAPDDKKSA